jgi:hypothetical protein
LRAAALRPVNHFAAQAATVLHNTDPLVALPQDLSVKALLGLADPDAVDWSRLRGIQYAGLAKASSKRILAHLIAAVATLGIFSSTVHPAFLGSWLALLSATLWYGARYEKFLIDADRRRMSRGVTVE